MGADDQQIHLLLPDQFFQLFPYIALADDDLVTQTSQRPTLSQILLQLTRIPPCCFGCRDHRIRAGERESQRGDDVGQVEFRPIMAGYSESMAEGFSDAFEKSVASKTDFTAMFTGAATVDINTPFPSVQPGQAVSSALMLTLN